MHSNHLFMVSTPLHLLVSISIVDTLAIKDAHLIFIDQVKGKPNPYWTTLESWQIKPFKSINIFYRPESSPIKKLTARRVTFAKLAKLLQELKPAHIYIGNDRRVEFQFCMQQMQKMGFDSKGYYLDEGMFTYVGRKASMSFSDSVIDNFFKRFFYGSWWKHPPTVGASDWIDTVFVSFPEIIHPMLKSKNCIHLTLTYWHSSLLQQFCSALIDAIGRPKNLSNYDVVITLPHESILAGNPKYKNLIKKLVENYAEKSLMIGIKYHPRDAVPDALGLYELSAVELIARELPFEALLPMIKTGAKVIGDFSTTLITTRLLRPDLITQAINHDANKGSVEFTELYKKIGIEIVGL